jgi:DNA excision repair protein ERCC-5
VQDFGLTSDKLVCVAMMTWSDFTVGVEIVGPVTALEVLAEFPGEGIKPLQDFRQWSSRVKGEMGRRNKTREKLRKSNLSQAFPSPAVDTSEERFSWAVSNLVVSETLPWTSSVGTTARWISC